MSISEHLLRPLLTAVLLGVAAGPAAAQSVLKVGSLAPDGSSWIEALRAIDGDLDDGTSGQVRLKIYPGGVQGDEDVMLRKIRIGQLQGAGLAGNGVGFIVPDVLALQLPFLFSNYDEVDYVVGQMEQYYRQAFLDAGYVLLGWSDIGFVYLMSAKPVRSVDDIRGRKVWRLQDEPITDVLFKKAKVTSVPLAIPDVLLGLQTNLVDVVYASPAAAIVLQWFTRVQYYTDLPINYTLGAFVLQRKAFEKLSESQQQLLLASAKRHIGEHNARGRIDNAEALAVMRREGVQPVAVPPAAEASFRDLVAETSADLVGQAFSREANDLVQKHLAEFRARADGGDSGE